MKTLLFLSAFFISSCSPSKDRLEIWNKNFPVVDVVDVIAYQKFQADSIENIPEAAKSYMGVDKFSFIATFSGEKRSLDKSIEMSMKNVYELFIDDPEQVTELVTNEYKFTVDNVEIWMPILWELEGRINNEIKIGQSAKLYCLYLYEHDMKSNLFNIFLVSEFQIHH